MFKYLLIGAFLVGWASGLATYHFGGSIVGYFHEKKISSAVETATKDYQKADKEGQVLDKKLQKLKDSNLRPDCVIDKSLANKLR